MVTCFRRQHLSLSRFEDMNLESEYTQGGSFRLGEGIWDRRPKEMKSTLYTIFVYFGCFPKIERRNLAHTPPNIKKIVKR